MNNPIQMYANANQHNFPNVFWELAGLSPSLTLIVMAPAVQTLLANVERDTSTINSGPNVTVVVCGVVVGVILVAGIMIAFFVLRGRRRQKQAEGDGDKTQKIACHKHTRSDTIDTPLLNIPHWLSISDGSQPHADHSSRPSSEQIHELDRSNYSFSLSEQVPFALPMVGTPIAVSQRAADSHRPSNKSSSRDLPRLTIPNCLPSPAKPTIPPLMMTSTMKSFSASHTQSLSICIQNLMSAFPQPPAEPPIVVAQTPLLPMPEHLAPISLDDSHSPIAASTLDIGRLFRKRSKRNSGRNLHSVSCIKRQDSVKSTASPDVSNDRMLSMKTNIVARNSLSGPMSALTDGPLSAVSLDPSTPSTIRTIRGLVSDFPVPPPCSLPSLPAHIFLKETTPRVLNTAAFMHSHSFQCIVSVFRPKRTVDTMRETGTCSGHFASLSVGGLNHEVVDYQHNPTTSATPAAGPATCNYSQRNAVRRYLIQLIDEAEDISRVSASYSVTSGPTAIRRFSAKFTVALADKSFDDVSPAIPASVPTTNRSSRAFALGRPYFRTLFRYQHTRYNTDDTGLAPDFTIPPASQSPMLRADTLTNTTASAPAQQQSFLLPRSCTERQGAQRSPPMSAGPHGEQSGNYEMRKAPFGPRLSATHKHSWPANLHVHESGVEKIAIAL